jgi:phenylalanyl-tRNA synthetase beta chain
MSDELPLMRTMVLDTLLTTLKRNLGRGIRDLALFEVSSVARPLGPPAGPLPHLETGQFPTAEELSSFRAAVPPQPRRVALAACGEVSPRGWWGPGRTVEWSDAVGAVQLLADRLHVPVEITSDAEHLPWHPGRCARFTLADGSLVGHAGELHPRVVAALELPTRTVAAEVDLDALFRALPERIAAEPLSTFPPVHQDISLQVSVDSTAAAVEEILVEGAGDLLERIALFDVYTGGGLPSGARSLTYRLTFRAPDRTLTDREVSALRDRAVTLASERIGAVAR